MISMGGDAGGARCVGLKMGVDSDRWKHVKIFGTLHMYTQFPFGIRGYFWEIVERRVYVCNCNSIFSLIFSRI